MAYTGEDPPDPLAMASALSQRTASPMEETEVCLKRVIQYVSQHSSGLLVFARGTVCSEATVRTDGDWAGDATPWMFCSGDDLQPNAALAPREVEFNSACVGASDAINVWTSLRESLLDRGHSRATVRKIPREEHASDILAHPGRERGLGIAKQYMDHWIAEELMGLVGPMRVFASLTCSQRCRCFAWRLCLD